jgi:plasmid stabilization system protein ParE
VTEYQIVVEPRAAREADAAANWYEDESPGLGQQFLTELNATYHRVLSGPLGYQVRRGDTRRAPLRRFPYAIFFAIEGDVIIVTAVLHVRRHPTEWQRRRGTP